ncbi:MAG: chondroitinase-B domain-containing protein [Candidatus Marinimicrobia bacterium]|nr:chondroitinase-B domain-containing protein [Candidatus Neomarinimicrobiota bacterium]
MKILIYILSFLSAVQLLADNTLVYTALEIHNIMDELLPGDTLTLNNGVWNDQRISIHAEGSATEPIVLIAETPGQVILTGFSTLAISGSWIEVNGLNFRDGYSTGSGVIEFRRYGDRANYCRVTNTTIFNFNPSSNTANYKWVSMYGQHNQVDHCYFAGKSHDGATFVVWLTEPQDRENQHIIEYNHFGYRPPLGFNGGETIRIGTSTHSMSNSQTIVRHNLFQQCNGEIEIISNKSCENIFFSNTFRDNEGCLTLRHGNRCRIEGNFFFGAGNTEAGGVRIIGTDHEIVNNYFEGLPGTGYRSAITFVMGVVDSPLNRYFQVENTTVVHNTLVNCSQSFLIGYGSSDDQTLPPINCTIANNAVDAGNYDVFHFGASEGNPQGFSYSQNMVMGHALGVTDTSAGIIWLDPELSLSEDDLYRPANISPLLGAASELNIVMTTDMDGQLRTASTDIGADQVSFDPIVYRPLSETDVGPSWISVPSGNQFVEAGMNTLLDAVETAIPGDTLFLVGVDYQLSEPIVIDKEVLILPGSDLELTPVISLASDVLSMSTLFDIQGNGELKITGVTIDGGGNSGNIAQRAFHANYNDANLLYALDIQNTIFQNFGTTGDYASVLEGSVGSFADSISFKNCIFKHTKGTLFILDNNDDDTGLYSVQYLLFEDCTFWDIPHGVLSIYGGDSNPYSVGPVVLIDQCTFHECGLDGLPVINARDVDVTTIANSIFSTCSPDAAIVELYNWSQIYNCDIYESGTVSLHSTASIGEGMLESDPQYMDATQGLFNLIEGSLLYENNGTNGIPYGDSQWHDPLLIVGVVENQPHILQPSYNYPNPFNAFTTFYVEFTSPGPLKLEIFDLAGRQVVAKDLGVYSAGGHDINMNLEYLASGVYVWKIMQGNIYHLAKMTVIK